MSHTSFSISKCAGVLSCLAWSTFSFAYSCPSNGVDVKTLGKDWKDISASCEALMNVMDATQIKQGATDLCCKSAIDYLKKNPEPCSEKARVSYRIKLGLAVCDTLKDPIYDYQRDYCVDQMLYHIFDPKVLAISDKCSPTGGKAARGAGGGGGKGGRSGGEGKSPDAKPTDATSATASPSQKPSSDTAANGEDHHHGGKVDSNGRVSESGATGAGMKNPDDLHLDDEAYTKCQRTRLAKYLEDLQEEINKNPSEEAACSGKAKN